MRHREHFRDQAMFTFQYFEDVKGHKFRSITAVFRCCDIRACTGHRSTQQNAHPCALHELIRAASRLSPISSKHFITHNPVQRSERWVPTSDQFSVPATESGGAQTPCRARPRAHSTDRRAPVQKKEALPLMGERLAAPPTQQAGWTFLETSLFISNMLTIFR
jgi:hypothetical protein